MWAAAGGASAGAQTAAPAVAASPGAVVTPANSGFDVFGNVFTPAQRKMLDRDPRCADARTKLDTFVDSDGKALQTGVDAMSALEKCAVLSRVGDDWTDFRDYVVTAAAAVAYRVGADAGDDRLLKRAVDDASHVTGFEASNSTVSVLSRATLVSPDSNSAGDHGVTDGPRSNSELYTRDSKHVAAFSGSYGKVATEVALAANTRLLELSTQHPQAH
jgi:hypothetical protein